MMQVHTFAIVFVLGLALFSSLDRVAAQGASSTGQCERDCTASSPDNFFLQRACKFGCDMAAQPGVGDNRCADLCAKNEKVHGEEQANACELGCHNQVARKGGPNGGNTFSTEPLLTAADRSLCIRKLCGTTDDKRLWSQPAGHDSCVSGCSSQSACNQMRAETLITGHKERALLIACSWLHGVMAEKARATDGGSDANIDYVTPCKTYCREKAAGQCLGTCMSADTYKLRSQCLDDSLYKPFTQFIASAPACAFMRGMADVRLAK